MKIDKKCLEGFHIAYYDHLSTIGILELDGKLRNCAKLLIRRYQNEKVYMGKNTSSVFLLYEEIDAFIEHFENLYRARYPKEKDEAVKERVIRTSESMEEIVACLIEGRTLCGFSLMLPVILYTLTLNSCFNKSSKQKSESRAKKLRSMKDKIRANSEKRDFTNYMSEYEIHRKNLCSIEREISCEDFAAFTTFEKAVEGLYELTEKIENDYRMINPNARKGFLLRGNADLSLAFYLWRNRDDVVYFEESAYIGEFLREILDDNRFDLDPLDKIIVMYVINEMDQALMRTGIMGNMPKEAFIDGETENGLLKWHYQSLSTIERGDILNQCIVFCEKKEEAFFCAVQEAKKRNMIPLLERAERMVGFECEIEVIEEVFDECYHDLKNSCVFDTEDVQLLMDFYLDKHGMEVGKQLRHGSLLYEKEIARKLLSGRFSKGYRTPEKEFYKKIGEGILLQRVAAYFNKLDLFVLWKKHIEKEFDSANKKASI